MLHCNKNCRAYLAKQGVSTVMSSQLTISAAFSVFAMAAFALLGTGQSSRDARLADAQVPEFAAPVAVEAAQLLAAPPIRLR
jgi:hypothetical protein